MIHIQTRLQKIHVTYYISSFLTELGKKEKSMALLLNYMCLHFHSDTNIEKWKCYRANFMRYKKKLMGSFQGKEQFSHKCQENYDL